MKNLYDLEISEKIKSKTKIQNSRQKIKSKIFVKALDFKEKTGLERVPWRKRIQIIFQEFNSSIQKNSKESRKNKVKYHREIPQKIIKNLYTKDNYTKKLQ